MIRVKVRLVLLLIVVGVLQSATTARAADAARPHIIFVEVDDLTYSWIGPYGSKLARTPTLDKLAAQGFTFDHALCQGMQCGPSRNAFVTGLYPHQLGFYQNGNLRKLPADAWRFPAALQRAGYSTAWIGKSHLKPNDTPAENGDNFNAFFGFDHSLHTLGRALVGDEEGGGDAGGNDEPNPYLQHLQQRGLMDRYRADVEAKRHTTLPEDNYLDGWFTKNTEQYIAGYDVGKPLFLWVNYSVPHAPFDVPDVYHEPFAKLTMPGMSKPTNFTHPASLIQKTRQFKSEKQAIDEQRGFLANIAFMDAQLNRILTALKQKGMLANAWIVFFSDQGVMSGAQGLANKDTLFRQVTQPSIVIRPPASMRSTGRIAQPVELMDLLPTFLEVAGAKEKSPAGVSLVPLMNGTAGMIDRKFAFGEIEKWIVVSDGHHRLIRSTGDEGLFLFDEQKDPENLTNIAKDHPDVVQALGAAIDAWLAQTGKRLPPKSY